MAKVVLLLAFVMIAATVANCTRVHNNQKESNQPHREEAQLKKVLEEHSQIVGTGLAGRLGSAYSGPVSRGVPPVHEHVSGHRPCRHGGAC